MLRSTAGTALVVVVAGLILLGCGARPIAPTVTPQAARVTGIEGGGLCIRLDMHVYNPNGYELTIRAVEAQVSVQGQDLGQVEHDESLPLPAGVHTPFSTQITVPWRSLPGLGIGALLSASIPFHVNGTVRVTGRRVTLRAPFVLDGQIPRSMLIPVGRSQ